MLECNYNYTYEYDYDTTNENDMDIVMNIYELILEKHCKFTQQNTEPAQEVYISSQKLQRIIKDEELKLKELAKLHIVPVFIYPERIFGLKIKIWNSYKTKVC